MRFRAPGIFNEIIRDVARKHGVPIVDMQSIFRAASPDSIPGHNLFFEHLHPNFRGQQLIAETLLKPVLAHMEVGSMQKDEISEYLLSEQNIEEIISRYEDESGNTTLLDLEFGNLRNFVLTSRWPYPERNLNINHYQPLGNRVTKQLAYNYTSGRMSWKLVHYKLAEHYISQGKAAMARAEYMAVYKAVPIIKALPIKIIDLYIKENKLTEALEFCTEAIKNFPENPLLLVRKALILMQMEQENESISQLLHKALQVNEQYKSMSAEQKAYLYYLMSMNHANLKELDQALQYIETSLQFNQNYKPAIDYKDTLLSRKSSNH